MYSFKNITFKVSTNRMFILKSLFIIRRYILKIILVLQRVRALLQSINGVRLAVVNGFPFVFLISILRF
jgi:hypothetical protein